MKHMYVRTLVFRIVTHGVFHLNLLHLGFNMAAFYPIGTRMEQAGGSLHLAWTIGVLLLGSGLLSLAVSIGIMYTVGLPSLMFHCDVGFSGVIFGLMIMQAMRLPPGRKTSFFGIDIPSRVYPVVLLVVIQLLLPRSVSLLGHLSGLAMGYFLCTRPGSVLIPSSTTMAYLDSSRIISTLAFYAGSSWVSAENANGFSYVAGSGSPSPSVLPTTTPQPYSASTTTATAAPPAASQSEPKFPGEGRVVGE